MSTRKVSVLALALIQGMALSAFVALGQSQTQTYPSRTELKYDRKAEMTVDGTIEKVFERKTPGSLAGTHLTLKAEKGKLDVYVGPQWFLSANGISVTNGNEVQITGSRVSTDAGDILLAREIHVGREHLTLRSKRGSPKWGRQ